MRLPNKKNNPWRRPITSKPTLYFANDHAGPDIKKAMMMHAQKKGYSIIDFGTSRTDSVDYPDYANTLAKELKKDPDGIGILICGTGIGMSIAANRHPWVRAAVCNNSLEMTKLSRAHNNANVLCLGARFIDTDYAIDALETFLNTPFEGGRHERRVNKFC